MDSLYKEDILKEGFQRRVIALQDDYEGRAVATLVRRLADAGSSRAVLYIHGFNDYFFQHEMAFRFNGQGINFYALDLRKYGRSWLSHQKFNDVRDLRVYFEEISLALEIIREEGNRSTLLMGHSTGGLIITLFAKQYTALSLFDGVVLNSPFFDFNESWLVKKCIPIVSFIGGYFPTVQIAGGFTEQYGKLLHRENQGEWVYDLTWKPYVAPRVNLGWIRAIYQVQQELKRPFEVRQPVLVLHSEKSVTDFSDVGQIQSRDSILNVKDIRRIAWNIRGDVQVIAVPGGIHDLILSRKEVRERVYKIIFDWLEKRYIFAS